MGWVKVLGFTTFIYKTRLLTGGISIVIDRNSLFDRSTQPTELSWVKVLGFTTFIYKTRLLTGSISIVIDRDSLFNRSTQPTELLRGMRRAAA